MLEGVFSPIITVFDEDGRLDFSGNEKVINNLIDNGVNGILFLGSTGEFFAMTKEERKEYIKFVIKTVHKRVPVLVGTGGSRVEEVIELTKFAEDEGADIAVVICPYYFQFNDQDLYKYYGEVASSVKIPILIYNFPDRTGININPDLVLRLARDYKNIIGIKDTVNGIEHTRKLISTVKSEIKDFVVFSGSDEYFILNLMAGGNGIIGALTNIAPGLCVEFYKAYKAKDFAKISSIQERINILMEIYEVSQPFIPTAKAAAKMMGLDIQDVSKKPAQKLNSEQLNRLRAILVKAQVL